MNVIILGLYRGFLLYGGIGGRIDTWHKDLIDISNSYNIGELVVTKGNNGGIFGSGDRNGIKDNLIITNCYNAGVFKYTVSKNNSDSYSLTIKPGTKTNSYYVNTTNARYFDKEGIEIDSNVLKSEAFSENLGDLWIQSEKGYPILKWQLKQ